ncbi:Protein E4.3 [Frankliniella fusca]|uniref:Protein E4.3 n=1 Tax=Frankliniella fusca TaxID=407009 RepID=A0AAE1GZ10_9NEOP|nr:Protein E4.3 [Frankliniella fusca]
MLPCWPSERLFHFIKQAMEEETPENANVEVVYRHILGEFSHFKNKTARVSFDHCAAVTPNLHANAGQPHVPLDSRFKYNVCLPQPFLPPSKINPDCLYVGDPFNQIVQEKEKWQSDLDTLIRNARKGKKWTETLKYGLHTNKVKKKDERKPIYTVNSYIAVAKHVAADPHPYFSGKYNWLGTGGCLSECSVNGEKYILHPTGENMSLLRVTSLDVNEEKIFASKQPPIRLPLAERQRIYQIAGSNVENRGIVAVRQEKVCSIVSLKEGLKRPLNAKTVLEIQEKDGVFVSIDISQMEDKQFCTLDSDQILKLWDLNTSSCTGSAEMPISSADPYSRSWGFVKFSTTSSNLFVLNRRTIYVKDRRMPLSQNSIEFSPQPIIDDCEDLSLLLNSLNSPLIYVATNHHLLSLDLRFGWIQRWSHLMHQPPMYGSVYPGVGKSDEVIILSSSMPRDSNAIVNKWKDGKPVSETFPAGLPSTADCLLRANAQGKCLSPSLKRRMQMSTTGLTLLWQDGKSGFMSLKATSIGDVISQQFLPEVRLGDKNTSSSSEQEHETEIKLWEGWEKDHEIACAKYLPTLRCPTYSYETSFNAIKTHKCPNKILAWQCSFPGSGNVNNNCQFCTEEANDADYKKMLCDLGCYKDLMAGVLLKAWDKEGLTTKVESRKKVENWLKDTSAKSDEFPELPEYDDCGFKVPMTPSRQPHPSKRMKRESLGF